VTLASRDDSVQQDGLQVPAAVEDSEDEHCLLVDAVKDAIRRCYELAVRFDAQLS